MASQLLRRGPMTRSVSARLASPMLNFLQNGRFSTDTVKVMHDEAKGEFYVQLGEEKAYLLYEKLPDGTVDLCHTMVPKALRGKGLSGVLTLEALNYMVGKNQPLTITCTYVQKYIKDNPNDSYLRLIKQQ